MRAGRPRRTATETREHVLDVAGRLFYLNGVRATGVDSIAAAADVAPTTLYRVFADKDDLVAAYVQREAVSYREWFDAATKSGRPAQERIVALFRALADQVSTADCRGCPFQLTLAETPQAEAAARVTATEVKVWVREQLYDLVRQMVPRRSPARCAMLAEQLMLIMEGVYASILSMPSSGPAASAVPLVRSVLGAAPVTRARRA